MNITLYTNNSEHVALNKSLTALTTLSGTLREESSMLDPVITLSDISQYLHSANYAYIDEFERYYFITQIDYLKNNLWRVHMHVDVLMSWQSQIRQQTGIVERNETEYNLKLNDGLFVTQQNPRIATFAFPYGFDQWDFVLAVSGARGAAE